nr:serine/arginine repetitive matrix protein 1-like [Aegilops tauschii subsp. strangulata]
MPPPPAPIPGAAPAAPPDATARLSISSRTAPPLYPCWNGGMTLWRPDPRRRAVAGLPRPRRRRPPRPLPRRTTPSHAAPLPSTEREDSPSLPSSYHRRARPRTWLSPLAAVTRALPSCTHAPRVPAAPSLAAPSAVYRAAAAALSLAPAPLPHGPARCLHLPPAGGAAPRPGGLAPFPLVGLGAARVTPATAPGGAQHPHRAPAMAPWANDSGPHPVKKATNNNNK